MSEQQEQTGTALTKRQKDDIEKLRSEGRHRVARIRETREISEAIRGVQFGDMHGAEMSDSLRWQIAQMCLVMGANPSTHVYILGGRPYLNADYFAEEANSHPRYVDHRQREISEATEEQLKETAEEKEELAATFAATAEEDGDEDMEARARRLRKEAAELREEATDLPLLRKKYGVPDCAESAVETVIERFVSSAPMDRIQSGEIDPQEAQVWIKAVRECNWAPNHPKQDPVGRDEPGKTARTRSLRRAAVKAFPAWREKWERRQETVERLIERDQAMLQEAGVSSLEDLDPTDVPALSSGNGEPEATSSEGARALPEGEPAEPEVVSEAEASEAEPAPAPSASSTAPGETEGDDEDEEGAEELSPVDIERRAYFANLRDGPGIEDDEARYAWQEEQGLPRSTREWELAHWRQANRTLTAEVRKTYQEACEALDIDADRLAEGHLDRPAKMIRDYEALIEKLEGASTDELEAAMEGEGEEPSLGL